MKVQSRNKKKNKKKKQAENSNSTRYKIKSILKPIFQYLKHVAIKGEKHGHNKPTMNLYSKFCSLYAVLTKHFFSGSGQGLH